MTALQVSSKPRFLKIALMTTLVVSGTIFADDPIWSWTGVDAAPNYKPVGCTDGTPLPMDSIQSTYMAGRYHADESLGDVTVYADIWANFDVHCTNGTTAHLTYSHRIVDDVGTAFSGGDPYNLSFPNPGASWDTLKVVSQHLERYSAWAIEMKGESQTVLEYVQLQQASNPGAFFPPADTSDHRVLARPVLFVHGNADNASGWGVHFANRTCGQRSAPLQGWTLTDMSSQESIVVPSMAYGLVQVDIGTVHATEGMTCAEDGRSVTDSAQIQLSPVQRSWAPTQPWLGFFARDNQPVFQYAVSGSESWTPFDGSLPAVTAPVRFRAILPRPGLLNLITQAWPTGSAPSPQQILATDLTDSTNTWWNAMVGLIPSLTKVFQFQNGKIHADSTLYDTVDLTIHQVLYNGGPSIRQSTGYTAASQTTNIVPWDLFKANVYQYLLPNTYSDVLVRDYKFSTAPDILARIERLDRGYDSANAQSGINRNGIYFYTALSDDGDSLSEFHPPMWNPALYGYVAAKGQSLQLWYRLDTVLTHHYGSREAWIHDSTKKIDIVCHSQGCLITRDALRNARDTSLGNPLNHIRKVVSLDSPAFGSALATQASDLSAAFSSMGQLRQLLLDTNGQLIPQKNVKLGISRIALPLAGGVGGIVEGYTTCSNAVGVPVASQIAGFDCAELGYIGGEILGGIAALTDLSWSLDGGLTGPYDLRVRTNTLGYTTINHLALSGPVSARQQMVAFADTTRHLSQTSPWIDSLRSFRYPTRPLDGLPVPFSVRYSPTTQHMVDTLGIQLAADIQKYCDDHDNWYSANCDYVRDLFTAVLGTNSITDDPTVNGLLQLTHNLQTQWTDQGDIAVEKGSQLMVNTNFGFNPGNRSLHFDTAGYAYQSAYGVGGGKFVAHFPITVESQDVDGTNVQLNLVRAGAALLGLDIHAALGYDTLAYAEGIQRLPRDGGSVLVPPMTSALASRPAVVQQLPVQGDFQLTVVSGDSLLQGFSVRTDSGGPILLAAVWDRAQGVYLTALHPDGSRSTKIVTNGARPVQVRLARQGSLFTLTATGLDGLVNSDTVVLALPAQVWLGALSTPAVAASDTLRPAFAGTVNVTDTSALLAEQPWNLVTLVRETATAQNLSQPAIVLVNKDSRALQGFSLYYEFQADPGRVPVLQSFQGPGTATLVSLGADRWRVQITESQAMVAPGTLFPSADGFQFQLNYQDWSAWPRQAEWSSYGGSSKLRWSGRIQLRDNQGVILTGAELPPPGTSARVAAAGLARDESSGSSNLSSPVIAVANTGGQALSNYEASWYVRAPVGQTVTLETWYAPDALTSLKSLGGGLWEVDLHFQAHILYPGQSTAEQKIGIHLSDWSTWDRSANPSNVAVTQGLVPVGGLVVRDSTGKVLWGNLPNLDDTLPVVAPPPPGGGSLLPVSVQIRDENPTDNTWIRPRLIVTNLGTTVITDFVLTYPLVVDTSKTIQVAPWYAPGCQVGLVRANAGVVDTARYVCQNLSVSPGGIWPNQGGAVVGFQYGDGTLWNRSADPFVSSWTQIFTPTSLVSVRALP